MSKDNREPDSEGEMLFELRKLSKALQAKHARRRRSPLIFVETFASTQAKIARFKDTDIKSVDAEANNLRHLLKRLKADYHFFQSLAEEQRQRNNMWEMMYKPLPPRLYEGGRADGNS